MRVLVVNAGSSSLKLRLLGPGDESVADEEPTVRRPAPDSSTERGPGEGSPGGRHETWTGLSDLVPAPIDDHEPVGGILPTSSKGGGLGGGIDRARGRV